MARIIQDLHPKLQVKIQELINACAKEGLLIGISECVRSVAEQDALYAQGRTKPGKIVTNCKGNTYSSMHQWGVAVDFFRNDGTGAYVDTDGFFTKVGKIGHGLGLEWGGNWKSPIDKPHFQLPDWGSTAAKLKNTYGTPDKFMISWSEQAPLDVNVSKTSMEVTKQNIRVVQQWVGTAVDGAWGKDSKRCMIKKIQSALPLPKTGVVSTEMFSKIGVLKEGHDDLLVQCLQGLLFAHGYNCQNFKGKFTNIVGDCVAQFQTDNGLTADRLAGKNTFRKLLQ